MKADRVWSSTHSSGGTGFLKSVALSDPSGEMLNPSSSGKFCGSSTYLSGHFKLTGKLFSPASGTHFFSTSRFVSLSQHLIGVILISALAAKKATKNVRIQRKVILVITELEAANNSRLILQIFHVYRLLARLKMEKFIINDVLADVRVSKAMWRLLEVFLFPNHLVIIKMQIWFYCDCANCPNVRNF